MNLHDNILQSLPAAIYSTDAVGKITFYNEEAVELWGVRPELGRSEFPVSWPALLARRFYYSIRRVRDGNCS